jgi:hypothetical protein
VRVLGVFQRGEAVERVDGAEPRVTGPGAVAPVLFEMGEERADQRRVEIVEVQLIWLLAGLLVREAQQQPERIAVGGDRLRAGVALRDQAVGVIPNSEERRLCRGHRYPDARTERLRSAGVGFCLSGIIHRLSRKARSWSGG